MRRTGTFVTALAAGLAVAIAADASDLSRRDDAVAMVRRAKARLAAEGPDKIFAAINAGEPAFRDRDLYVFVIGVDGMTFAHGARPALIGKNMRGLRDPDGVRLIERMIDVAGTAGAGWVTYKWPNPVTKAIEEKSSYVEQIGDYVVGVGVYGP